VASRRGGSQRRPIAGAGGLRDISEVAVRLFAQRGYGATRMKDIARELGVQAPSLYNYVDSKRRLLEVLCVEAMRGMRDALRAGIATGTDPAGRVLNGMEAQVLFRLRHPYHLQVVNRESLHLRAGVREEVASLRDEQRALWEEVVRTGVEQGRFATPSPELASQVLLEMCSSPQVMRFSLSGEVPERQLVDGFGGLALALLDAPADSR
jgi:TetR/AcrR family transcriptional regulator, cholesterol catabolism regulator